jgi:L-amino acid N-acyltransferase
MLAAARGRRALPPRVLDHRAAQRRSVAFHERWGFVHRGTLSEAGYKFGRYLDVAYYERSL